MKKEETKKIEMDEYLFGSERIMGCDESVVTMSAVRYALGSSSYAPSCVMDWCKKNKDRLKAKNISVIERDILERIEEFPDLSYKQEWLDLIDYLNK